MVGNKLLIAQLEAKMKILEGVQDVAVPPTGWIRATRSALGMSMQQLAKRLGVSRQSVSEMEKREKEGSLTLKSLKEAAKALDMTLVYGLVPKDGSLEALIDRKALELAQKIVTKTSVTMQLEDQRNSPDRIRKAIEERAEKLKLEKPRILWD